MAVRRPDVGSREIVSLGRGGVAAANGSVGRRPRGLKVVRRPDDVDMGAAPAAEHRSEAPCSEWMSTCRSSSRRAVRIST
jgi:hypothetical protein